MTIDQLGIIRRPGRAHARDRDRPILGPLDGRDRGPRQGEAPIRIEAREQDGGPTAAAAAAGPPEVPAVPGRVSRGGGLVEAPGIPLGVVLDGRFAGAVLGTAGGGGGGVLPGLAGLPRPPRHLSPVGSFKRGGREKPRNQKRERERGFEPVEVERVEIDRERKEERESRWKDWTWFLRGNFIRKKLPGRRRERNERERERDGEGRWGLKKTTFFFLGFLLSCFSFL